MQIHTFKIKVYYICALSIGSKNSPHIISHKFKTSHMYLPQGSPGDVSTQLMCVNKHIQRGNDIRILTEVVPGFLPHHSMVTTFPRILLRGAAHVVWMYMEVAAIVTPQKQSSIYFRHLFDAKNKLYRRYDHYCKMRLFGQCQESTMDTARDVASQLEYKSTLVSVLRRRFFITANRLDSQSLPRNASKKHLM